jgi:hypothetical protein
MGVVGQILTPVDTFSVAKVLDDKWTLSVSIDVYLRFRANTDDLKYTN